MVMTPAAALAGFGPDAGLGAVLVWGADLRRVVDPLGLAIASTGAGAATAACVFDAVDLVVFLRMGEDFFGVVCFDAGFFFPAVAFLPVFPEASWDLVVFLVVFLATTTLR
jgi:hypothetical protein